MGGMAVKVVKLRLRGTHLAVMRLDRQVQRGVREALHETALFGLTAVEREIRRAKPRPVASNTYRLAWAVKRTKEGAVLGNSAAHAIQVEVGRRPGKHVPLEPLREWVMQKRIVRPARTRKAKPLKPLKPSKSNKTYSGLREAKREAQRRAKQRKRFLRATASKHRQAMAIAARISKAIAKRGIKGRYILANTMPMLRKALPRNMRKSIRGALAAHRG